MRMPCYCAPLNKRPIDGENWELQSCFGFVTSRNELIAVPVNRHTNLASIPKKLRWIYKPTDFPEEATIHDDLTNEFHNDWPRGTVFDYTQEAVKIFARDIHKLDQHTFEAMAYACQEYSFRIDSKRVHDIMTTECMATRPSVRPWLRRKIVRLALKLGGPRWTIYGPQKS